MEKWFKFENLVMGALIWSLFFIVSLQFFTRYVLNNSLGWTEELARMNLIVLTYAGSVVCVRLSEHIQVDLIVHMMPQKAQAWLKRFYDLINAVFFCFLAWTAVNFAMQTRLKLSSIPLPKSIIFWFCAICLLLMAYHYFMKFLTDRPTGNDASDAGINKSETPS